MKLIKGTSCKIQEDSEHLNALRHLTERLPSFPPSVQDNSATYMETKMEKGTSLAWSLKNIEAVACADWFNSAGSVFPAHTHGEKEFIIVYKGHAVVYVQEENSHLKHDLKAGDFLYVKPNAKHYAEFILDTWYLAITVPASKEWPS